MQDMSNRSSLLISGGAGDCKIYVTDCDSGRPIRTMTGHTGKEVNDFFLSIALFRIFNVNLKNYCITI